MMLNIKYGSKETAIYNGVLKLVQSGKELQEIKASDIAAMAGIGKGTLYNYFSSKEEILAKSVIYMVDTDLSHMIQSAGKKKKFKDKCYCVFNSIENCIKNKNSTIKWIMSDSLTTGLLPYFYENAATIEGIKKRIMEFMADITDTGEREGVIGKHEDRNYVVTVLLSAVMGYSNNFTPIMKNAAISPDKSKDNAYEIIIKSLN